MENIAFRVDAGPEIGIGHLMRCLALANVFPDESRIVFISKPMSSDVNNMENEGYTMIPIPEDINYEEEIEFVKKILKEYEIDIFIGDTYQVDCSPDIDQNYLSEVETIVKKTVMISPKVSLIISPDIIINGNVFATGLKYKRLNDHTKFLIGPKYTLLREEFQNMPDKEIKEEVNDILVTMGGSDPANLIPKVIEAIKLMELKDLHVDIVIGPAMNNIDEILELIREVKFKVSLIFNATNMSELMLKADLAVSAGGGTLYELAVTGTPAIALLQVDNQIQVAEAMENEGTIINLGFGNRLKIEKLADNIKELISDVEERKKMSRRGKKLIDGLGAKRCVDVILNRQKEC